MNKILQPKVSIVVPIYGVEKYLHQCVDSILAQTLKDIEIILVDNGSKDKCPEIVDEYAKKDSRIVAIHKPNGGYGSAINKGLDIAKGEYVGIVESDDYIDSDMYEKLYNRAINTKADMVKGNFDYVSDKTGARRKETILMQLFEEQKGVFTLADCPKMIYIFASIWSAIYKKDWLNKHRIRVVEDIKPYEDIPFFTETISKADKIVFEPGAKYNYRIDVEGSSTSTLKPTIVHYLLQKGRVREILAKNNMYNEEIKEYYWKSVFVGSKVWFLKKNNRYKRKFYKEMKLLFNKATKDEITFKYFTPSEKREFNRICKASCFAYILHRKVKRFGKNIYSTKKTASHRIIKVLGIKINIKNKNKNKKDVNLAEIKEKLEHIENLIRIQINPQNLPKANGYMRIQQTASLALLNKLKLFLEKNKYSYWLDFGTLLGGARHSGFIPWDDDIDISMPRKDFENLKKNISDFAYGDFSYSIGDIIRVFYKNTSAQVDIFPYDTGNQVEIPQHSEYKKIVEKLASLYKCIPFNWSNVRVSTIPEDFKENLENIYVNEILENKPIAEKGYMFLAFHCFAFKRVLYRYDDIFPLGKIKFEGEEYPCPNKLDKYLSLYWGNYMELPNNCVSRHPNMIRAMQNYENIIDMYNLIDSDK
ncbi:MAG: glycosyltransferase [Alphaproteobacteria bacterium]|nr:glycosyltransferase [Alphaproteobacteria bacterium]